MSPLPRHKEIAIQTFAHVPGSVPAYMTVWVHGTSNNPLIRKIHASPKGITPLADLPEDWGLRRMGEALALHDAHRFPREAFFAFGWSGKLSFKARDAAARDLAAEIRKLAETHLKSYGVRPLIRLIAHSHGCNVVLNASEHLMGESSALKVEELVLLACPVQHATAHKVESSVFTRIYALYSTSDWIQVMDPHGLNREGVDSGGQIFSGRRFPGHGRLVQAEVRWNGRGLSHAGFIRQRFGAALPSLLAELRENPHDCVLSIKPVDKQA